MELGVIFTVRNGGRINSVSSVEDMMAKATIQTGKSATVKNWRQKSGSLGFLHQGGTFITKKKFRNEEYFASNVMMSFSLPFR